MKRALVTGVTGQDGSYLAEFLLKKGYKVYGLVRRSSLGNLGRITHLLSGSYKNENFSLIEGDLLDSHSIKKSIEKSDPCEIYNLAAMSHVHTSFQTPEYTANVDALGTLRILESIMEYNQGIRFYQASTSELYGKVRETPQKETTPFHPCSPYGVAKIYAYWAVINYRETYNLYACNGILFNHESPRRGENFVSRKITLAIAKIIHGLQNKLVLGNLESKRDWGYAPEFIEGMWLMLQQNMPDDYVLSTNQTNTVRKFVELAFKSVNIDIIWEGTGVNEKGLDSNTGKVLVEIDPELYRPLEVDLLHGDSSKAKNNLGWSSKMTFEGLIKLMISSDIEMVSKKCQKLVNM